MSQSDVVDDAVRQVFAAAGMSAEALLLGGAIALAMRIIGPAAVYEVENALTAARLHTVCDGVHRIVLQAGLPHRRVNFLVARMLVRLVAAPAAVFECAAAARVVAPRDPFLAELDEVGFDIPTLASRFAITETCAALRAIEVTKRDGAVVTPDRVHKRGPMLAHASDDDVIAMSRRTSLRSCTRIAIGDEPGRVALMKAG